MVFCPESQNDVDRLRQPFDFMFRDRYASPCIHSRRTWNSDIAVMGLQVAVRGLAPGQMYLKHRLTSTMMTRLLKSWGRRGSRADMQVSMRSPDPHHPHITQAKQTLEAVTKSGRRSCRLSQGSVFLGTSKYSNTVPKYRSGKLLGVELQPNYPRSALDKLGRLVETRAKLFSGGGCGGGPRHTRGQASVATYYPRPSSKIANSRVRKLTRTRLSLPQIRVIRAAAMGVQLLLGCFYRCVATK